MCKHNNVQLFVSICMLDEGSIPQLNPYLCFFIGREWPITNSLGLGLGKLLSLSLTWQKVQAPVQVRKAESRGSHDLSRFWSHLTENLLFQTYNNISV